MMTPVKKRNHAKFCVFHGEVGHSTDECMHLKKKIEEMLKTEKLLHLIKELKQKGVRKLRAVPSTVYEMLKIPVEGGVITLKSSRPRVSVKGQILADFIVKRPEEDSHDTLMEEVKEIPEPWILFTDGSSCTNSSGARLTLTNPEGMEFTYALRFRFDDTNNEVEYEALISELRIAEQMVVEEEGDNWMTPIFKYLAEDTLPTDVKEARAVNEHAYGHTIRRGKSLKDWVLLAYHAQRRNEANKSMLGLS
nr:reverse transcriptase domain-containing protein [Tanacetum cinerariifolium]